MPITVSTPTPIATGNTEQHVIVGMSGGVDSSVAALLLLQQGYQVAGLFMKNWEEDDGTEYCTAMKDMADAANVCDKLGIQLHTANFSAEYWDRVFEHFLAEYRLGRTPNPDILCNKEIKFKAFLDYALELGADYIATGHYVRKSQSDNQSDNNVKLLKGVDNNKDQSYFLHAVANKQLAKALFPLGELTKDQVRQLAQANGLVTHDKKDSTGICFIGERRFKDFLQTYIPAQPGSIETVDGNVIGTHNGLMFHTLGQRQGLGIGGVSGASEAPWYVVAKDLARNVLVVAQGNDHPKLFSKSLIATKLDWISAQHPTLPFTCTAKTRYRQSDQGCQIFELPPEPSAAGTSNQPGDEQQVKVKFDQPQRAVTPGQSIVFYNDDVCLGGGIIESTEPAYST